MLSRYSGEEIFHKVLLGSWSNGIELYHCAKGERFIVLFIPVWGYVYRVYKQIYSRNE